MKKGTWLFLGCILAVACGRAPKAPPTPALTAVGTAVGAEASELMGPDGGILASADGALSLRVPPGALAVPTSLTVQAITAEAPGATRAFRLGPEGQTFLSPVELVLSFREEDVAGSAAEALEVGFQNANGSWSVREDFALDAAARTLTGTTTHFSDWSMLQGVSAATGRSQGQGSEGRHPGGEQLRSGGRGRADFAQSFL